MCVCFVCKVTFLEKLLIRRGAAKKGLLVLRYFYAQKTWQTQHFFMEAQ